jgi:hypothetical protein
MLRGAYATVSALGIPSGLKMLERYIQHEHRGT